MKNEMNLNEMQLGELKFEELKNFNGGGLFDKIFKFTWTGWFDGDASNDECHLYIFGYQLF